jgi:hypothetical protein
MKKIILTFLANTFIILSFAQPGFFNYQAVVRDAEGKILANKDVSFKIEIIKGMPDGSVIYTETHEVTTNELGLVTLKIFGGMQSGMMTPFDIDWAADNYYMKVYLDADDGADYTEMGTSQLLTVPYAMHAYTVEKNNLPDTYSNLVITDSLRIGPNGIKIGEIYEITGTTDATNNYISFDIPKPNVRVLNVEISTFNIMITNRFGLGYTGTGGTISYKIAYSLLGTPSLTIYYPDELKNKTFTVLLMTVVY